MMKLLENDFAMALNEAEANDFIYPESPVSVKDMSTEFSGKVNAIN